VIIGFVGVQIFNDVHEKFVGGGGIRVFEVEITYYDIVATSCGKHAVDINIRLFETGCLVRVLGDDVTVFIEDSDMRLIAGDR